ncbi:MAG: hypothetical protein OQK82_06420 [Candidatus Pacearchaeota archaeon]|nr:hypothetical protein [Candidatus Pacearchaeota archaeon]
MKRSIILFVVAGMVLMALGACNSFRGKFGMSQKWMEVDVNTTPQGAKICLTKKFDGYIYVNEKFFEQEADLSGNICIGRAPLKAHFEVISKDSDGTMLLPVIVARWDSGAIVDMIDIHASLDYKSKMLNIDRPKDVPGLAQDIEREKILLQMESNRIQEEGVEEQSRGNTGNAVFGVGLLCVLMGKCH